MSTSKFERVLSDEEMTVAINDGCTADLFSLAERVEQAVLAKLAEQEPVAWAASAALQQDYYLSYGCPTEAFASKEALLNEYDKSDAVPLYARPMLPTSLSVPPHTPSSQGLLDSSNHIADVSKMVAPEGWQLVPVEPTPEMIQAATSSDEEYSKRSFGEGIHLCQGGYDHYLVMLAAAPTHKDTKE